MKRLLERGSMEEIKPLLFGVGLALAAPVAGYAVARAVSNVSKATEFRSSSVHKRFRSDTIGCSRGIKDVLRILQNNEQASANIIWSTSRILTKCSRNGEKLESQEEQEIENLNKLVQDLQKREDIIQIPLLMRDGLREQAAAAVIELEDQLRLSSAETDSLNSEIKSLEDENQKLKLQASEHLEAMNDELELTKSEAKQLEGNLASFSLRAKEKIALLEQKMTMMLDEQKILEDKQNRFKDLEYEAAELRRINLRLAEENGDLKLRIRSASTTPSSNLQTIQTEFLEEISQLREENEELKNKMEQVKSDHFEDVKELTYLRWINACLRYKLSNHRHMISSEKTTPLDVNTNLNPQSELKADELIHDCANIECMHEKKTLGLECHDLSERSTDQCDDTSNYPTKGGNFSKKDKFFGKVLKKMALLSRKKSSKVAVEDDSSSPSSCISEIMEEHLIGGTELNGDDRWQHGSQWIQANFRSTFSSIEARRFDCEGDKHDEQGSAAIGFRRMNQGDGHGNSKELQFAQVLLNAHHAPREIN